MVGRSLALEMLLTGRWVEAQEALRMKLVNSVTPRDELINSAEAMAARIASHDPRAVQLVK